MEVTETLVNIYPAQLRAKKECRYSKHRELFGVEHCTWLTMGRLNFKSL